MKYFLICIALLALFSCSKNESDKDNIEELKIVATTGMIGDALHELLDSTVQIEVLMGPGVDPHLYKATQGDLRKLQEADIIVYNGLHLEGKMTEIFERLETSKTCIALGSLLDESYLIQIEGFENTYDPHIWFDVDLWRNAIQALSKELLKIESVSKKTLAKNTEAYNLKLLKLDKEVQLNIDSIPDEQKILVTAHDAFTYFGRAYGVEVRGLQGISTLSEAGIKDITSLVGFLSEKKIKAVFVETSVSERSINAVVQGCQQRGHNIYIGGDLYSDAMGAEGTFEGTYLGMVTHNVNTIKNALAK